MQVTLLAATTLDHDLHLHSSTTYQVALLHTKCTKRICDGCHRDKLMMDRPVFPSLKPKFQEVSILSWLDQHPVSKLASNLDFFFKILV